MRAVSVVMHGSRRKMLGGEASRASTKSEEPGRLEVQVCGGGEAPHCLYVRSPQRVLMIRV